MIPYLSHLNQLNQQSTKMTPKEFFQHIRAKLAKDEIEGVLKQLQQYLADSPKLDEIIQQSGRFAQLRKQIRLGVVQHADASLTRNQIRLGILDLLQEMESNIETEELQKEAVSATANVTKTITQNAEKIYNIEKIDNANFS